MPSIRRSYAAAEVIVPSRIREFLFLSNEQSKRDGGEQGSRVGFWVVWCLEPDTDLIFVVF